MFRFLTISSILVLLGLGVSASPGNKSCPVSNICFALDQSGSISDPQYEDIQNFTISAASQIASRTTNTIIYSAFAFSDAAAPIQQPTSDLNGEFIPSVEAPRLFRGSTSIRSGLQACLDAQKGQPGNLVTVLLTDGAPNPGDNPLELKPDFVSAGIDLVTVGVGPFVDETLLTQLATSPEFYFPVEDTSDLVARVAEAVDEVCMVSIPNFCEEAYQACDFQFLGNDNVPEYVIGERPDFVFTDPIVSRTNPEIGILNTNGIVAEFLEASSSAPITDFGSPRLTPTHFKPFSIPRKQFTSGIGHQTFTGNQLSVSRERCVRIYFTNFQLTTSTPSPRVLDNVNNAQKSDNKCVVFRTL